MIQDIDPRRAREAIRKPSVFAEEFIGVEPFDYQKKFLDCGSNRRIFCAGRRVGKSRSTAWLALWFALTHRDAEILLLAKAQRQSMELFNQIKREIRNSNASEDEWGIPRQTRTEMNFTTGSRITCLPVGRDGSNIRGYGADLLVVDEAAFVANEIFQEVLSPFLAVGENVFVMTSTPKGKRGYFWERWDEARRGQNNYTRIHARTHDNPLVDQSWIDEQKRTLTPMQFKQEILGQFQEASDAYFTQQEVHSCGIGFDPEKEGRPVRQETETCYLGADIAHTGDDESVYISIDAEGNVYDVKHKQNTKLTECINDIITYDNYNDYAKILIDETGMGQGVVDVLEEHLGRKVEGFTFTQPKKADLYSALKNKFQNEEIRFNFNPNDNQPENKMVQQLTALTYDITKTGRTKIGHPSGGHDDFPDALALASRAMEDTQYAMSDSESMQPFHLGDLRSE